MDAPLATGTEALQSLFRHGLKTLVGKALQRLFCLERGRNKAFLGFCRVWSGFGVKGLGLSS